MQFDHCLLSYVLVSICCLAVATDHEVPGSKAGIQVIEHRSDVEGAHNPRSYRQMVPARPVNDLKARNKLPTSFLKHDHVLHFIEGTFLPDISISTYDAEQTTHHNSKRHRL